MGSTDQQRIRGEEDWGAVLVCRVVCLETRAKRRRESQCGTDASESVQPRLASQPSQSCQLHLGDDGPRGWGESAEHGQSNAECEKVRRSGTRIAHWRVCSPRFDASDALCAKILILRFFGGRRENPAPTRHTSRAAQFSPHRSRAGRLGVHMLRWNLRDRLDESCVRDHCPFPHHVPPTLSITTARSHRRGAMDVSQPAASRCRAGRSAVTCTLVVERTFSGALLSTPSHPSTHWLFLHHSSFSTLQCTVAVYRHWIDERGRL